MNLNNEDNFIQLHIAQLRALGVPESLHLILKNKLENLIFDASTKFGIEEYEDGKRNCVVVAEEGVQPFESIYLIDHTYSFQDSEAGSLRTSTAALSDDIIDRLCGIMAIPTICNETNERRVKSALASDISHEIWKYVGCYSLGNQWVWYLQDEVGSSIGHSSEPNVICVPFIHISSIDANLFPTMTPYCLIWPIQSIAVGDSVERDYCNWITSPLDRICHLVDWLGEDNIDDDLVEQIITNSQHHYSVLNEIHQHFIVKMKSVTSPEPITSLQTIFQTNNNNNSNNNSNNNDNKFKLRVWTSPDDPLRLKHLTCGLSHSAFELVDNRSHAHIIWDSEPFKETPIAWINSGYSSKQQIINQNNNNNDYDNDNDDKKMSSINEEDPTNHPLYVSPDIQIINQFPYEGVFLIKAHLAREIARNIGLPEWWNPSYDMETHLMQFVGDYLIRRRKIQSLNSNEPFNQNVWILKPSIGTRSKGHVITDSLIHMIRLLEIDKNRVAQKYVERPLLWKNGRKFDMRFIVCVRQFNPLELYVYNVFWTRVANKSSESGTLLKNNHEEVWEDRERAYTAMWVLEGVKQDGILPDYEEIIHGIEELYPSVKWNNIKESIHKLLREVFYGLSSTQPNGMKCLQSRSLYGCDIILEQQPSELDDVIHVQPKLLEVTFVPSNSAVNQLFAKQYPNYVNDIFGCLFLGECNENLTRLL